MKAADFHYECPATLGDALKILADPNAMPLAGGQSLMPMMNFRLAGPETLVDLNRVDGLAGIEQAGDHVRIGAMTRYVDLMQSEVIAAHVPLFGMALPHVAHEAIRNRGTIGGSVALADPAAEMPALLLALGASIVCHGPDGELRMAADDFFVGMYETALPPGALITAIEVPVAAPDAHFGFYEIARRHGDYAMVGIAIHKSNDWRIAFFSVADRALRATAAEAVLGDDGSDLDGAVTALEVLDFAGDLNGEAATKRHLAGVALRRAVAGMGS